MEIQDIEEIREPENNFLVDISSRRINELIRAVKQLDKQIKELKGEN